jgi:hypothetical protein
MTLWDKLKKEFKAVLFATLFFAGWFLAMVAIKTLVLAEHKVAFSGWLGAIVSAAVIAKVVLVLEHIPLGSWLPRQPAWVDVLVRTVLYTFGVFLLLLGEKMFEQRHEYAGFSASLAGAFDTTNVAHAWATTICVAWGLLVFNGLIVVHRRVGTAALVGFFSTPLPAEQAPKVPT